MEPVNNTQSIAELLGAQADAVPTQPFDDSFKPWAKIHRLSRDVVVTEKIDGTNAQILFRPDGTFKAGSRNRWLTPEADNHGFYAFVEANKAELFAILGAGRHYGEWWGRGIGRNYGKTNRCFSLFNVSKWEHLRDPAYLAAKGKPLSGIDELSCVPVLRRGVLDHCLWRDAMLDLRVSGSVAQPHYMNPEGVVVFHEPSQYMFKKTFEHDGTGKPVDETGSTEVKEASV